MVDRFKQRLLAFLKKWGSILLNPRLLVCIAIAWMITNGWSYVFVALGTWLNIPWMTIPGGAYMSLLWFPFTPEKILTVALALFLLRLLFPRDRRTLAVLQQELQSLKEKWRNRKQRKNAIGDMSSGEGEL